MFQSPETESTATKEDIVAISDMFVLATKLTELGRKYNYNSDEIHLIFEVIRPFIKATNITTQDLDRFLATLVPFQHLSEKDSPATFERHTRRLFGVLLLNEPVERNRGLETTPSEPIMRTTSRKTDWTEANIAPAEFPVAFGNHGRSKPQESVLDRLMRFIFHVPRPDLDGDEK